MQSINNREGISGCLEELRDEDNTVQLSDFIVSYKSEIVASFNESDSRYFKADWIKRVKLVAKPMNITIDRSGKDKWFIIEKCLKDEENEQSQPSHIDQFQNNINPKPPTATSEKSSSLGSILNNDKKLEVVNKYNNMNNDLKWQLNSGRFVEDVMLNFVNHLNYEHPVCDVILDLDDDNWQNCFTEEELHEINEQAVTNHQPFPEDMQNYLDLIPKTIDVAEIFKFLHNQEKFIDPVTESDLYWLHATLKSTALLFINKYLPVTDQTERDLIRRVWVFMDTVFDNSEIKFRSEKASYASKVHKNKKRKISAIDRMERECPGQMSDMLISYDRYEFGLAEVGKDDGNTTKELNEGRTKATIMMKSMLTNLVKHCPSIEHDMKIVGFIMTGMKIVLLELSNPIGYVNIVKRSDPMYFPVHSKEFYGTMLPILICIWISKSDIENRLDKLLVASLSKK